MAAREDVGMLEVGVAFAPILVAKVIVEDFGLSEFEACLPQKCGGISPASACRGRAEPDASNDWGCGRRLCELMPFP